MIVHRAPVAYAGARHIPCVRGVCVAARKGEAQLVTRHNQPVAVVLSVEEYTRLKALEERTLPSFAEQLLALPQDDEAFSRIELEPRPIGF